MPKYCKNTLWFMNDSKKALDKIELLCNDFPEVKIVGIRNEQHRSIVYYDIKYPLKIKENIQLFFNQHNLNVL